MYCILLGLAAAGTVFVLAAMHVNGQVAHFPEFNVTIERVELDAASCEWLPEEARKEIETIPLGLSNLNLLSQGVLESVQQRLVGDPWVKEVCCVEKVFPDRIRFSVLLRRPVAWVSLNGSMYLTDSEGVRLPVQKSGSLYARHLPVIVGVPRSTSLPRSGMKWRTRHIQDGICVAGHLLTDQDLLLSETGRVRSIDVAQAGRHGRGVVLVTEDKRRIEWGRTGLSEKARLLSDEQKLANLRLILKGESSIDDRSYYLLWTTPTAGPREQAARNPR